MSSSSRTVFAAPAVMEIPSILTDLTYSRHSSICLGLCAVQDGRDGARHLVPSIRSVVHGAQHCLCSLDAVNDTDRITTSSSQSSGTILLDFLVMQASRPLAPLAP